MVNFGLRFTGDEPITLSHLDYCAFWPGGTSSKKLNKVYVFDSWCDCPLVARILAYDYSGIPRTAGFWVRSERNWSRSGHHQRRRFFHSESCAGDQRRRVLAGDCARNNTPARQYHKPCTTAVVVRSGPSFLGSRPSPHAQPICTWCSSSGRCSACCSRPLRGLARHGSCSGICSGRTPSSAWLSRCSRSG